MQQSVVFMLEEGQQISGFWDLHKNLAVKFFHNFPYIERKLYYCPPFLNLL